jgi:ABC-2 type transport system ATP-binding protein
LLIFDEPFSGFDPVNANIIKDEILALRIKAQPLFSTHRMESVEELCDHIALIHKSNKLIEGKLDDVKRRSRPIALKLGFYQIMLKDLCMTLHRNFLLVQPILNH